MGDSDREPACARGHTRASTQASAPVNTHRPLLCYDLVMEERVARLTDSDGRAGRLSAPGGFNRTRAASGRALDRPL
ncbi:hypothetical protein SKAU_G00203640 [Synaphobranchus kaupii]|uniref:Uncharacterized protein n=1 Tax=Synaphobranchus kaupii TaxID=118154 RepID=A0A9Q1FFY5_SYNKA|nr:hypothetical protein SKAU_G00203640 [Synaphobranchus kaupii]